GRYKRANKIMEALASIRIPGEARQVLDVILRKTYGWNKEEDEISLSQFKKATGLLRPNIIRARGKLLNMNIISVIQKDNTDITTYRFQKNYTKWKPLSKRITLSKKIISVIQKDNLPLSKRIHTKDTITKPTITKAKEVVSFDFDKRKFLNITIEDKAGWLDAYPACDIDQELRKLISFALLIISPQPEQMAVFLDLASTCMWFKSSCGQ
ncbi:unnamed protein product, partial [marine sediment metagenome]